MPTPPATQRRRRGLLSGFGVLLLVGLGLAVFVQSNFRTVVVTGDSMLPRLHGGDRLLVSKAYWIVGSIERGDIVVIKRAEDEDFSIKRVHRLGGETVDWRNVPEDWHLANGPYRVPSDAVFVLGDNRRVSVDSRTYGPVPTREVIGKVVRLP